MKLIIFVVVAAGALFYVAGRHASDPANWRSSGYSRPRESRNVDLRVDTPAGKMYPGLPKYGETVINGKRYITITTVKSK